MRTARSRSTPTAGRSRRRWWSTRSGGAGSSPTDDGFQPTDAPLTRALEVHPQGRSDALEVWVDRRYARAGYGWCFPAGEELRIGACSYEPIDHVREGTDRLSADLGGDQVRYQGNWIPHRLRQPTEAGVFFVGDSAGQCLPLTAEGIRTALYYGIAVGREMRAVFEGRRSRQQAAANYTELHDSHRTGFRHPPLRPEAPPPHPGRGCWAPRFRIYKTQKLIDLTFKAYLELAPPAFAAATAGRRRRDDSNDKAELSATQAV